MSLQLAPSEFQSRADRLREFAKRQQLSGVVLFDNFHITYFTGFAFIPTERPICFAMNADGERVLFVPRLEVEHAKAEARVERVESYLEYPGDPHPMAQFADIIKQMGMQKKIGGDNDGYPWILGYHGDTLSSLLGSAGIKFARTNRGDEPVIPLNEFSETEIYRIDLFVEHLMSIKSAAELALIRESVKWGNLAHRLLQKYTRVGANETEVSLRASAEATLTMLDTLGHLYQSQSMWSDGAEAGYRGQIGRNAAIPHSLTTNATFMAGDVLVTGANAPMWGYNSEVERTMIVGEPGAEQARFFEHMKALQETAFDALKPGAKCSDVDRAVRAYFDKHNLMPYWRHHSGHAIGLRYHEGPFLDSGDDTVLEPGMVFTVEPGLYVPDPSTSSGQALGGFRHSDTIVVTQDGIEILTYYPRDLASLTIPV
ncbi:MAG: aminopeptidase P family protein [Chloroflexota bacterium]|nr:aminopeptidase P family protein [Chloroflexota bacterium]